MLKNEETKKIILKAIYAADVGINDISLKTRKLDPEIEFKKMSPKVRDLFIEIVKEKNVDKDEIIEIKTIHKNVQFDLNEESEGTKRIFSLIGPWIDALQNGRILVLDEIDTKLHSNLNEFLIKLFHDKTQNKKNAQLIITTHNTNLLDIQDIFRRDQIWFTEKEDKSGSTDLYSLVEFSPRKDKNIEKGYLAGKYGAIPFIKNYNLL